MNFGRRGFLRRATASAIAAPFAGRAIAETAVQSVGARFMEGAPIGFPIPPVNGPGGWLTDPIRAAARELLEAKERENNRRERYRAISGFDRDIAALRAPAIWWRLAQQQIADEERYSTLERLRKQVWG